MQFVSWFGNGFIPVALTIYAGYLIFYKNKIFAWVFLGTNALGYLTKAWAQNAFQQDRPWAYGCQVLTRYAEGYGFPSGHVTHYTIFFGLLIYFSILNKKEKWAIPLGIFSIFMLSLIGYSRIYLGAHWPKDVIAGYVLGGVFLIAGIKTYQYLNERYDKKSKLKR